MTEPKLTETTNDKLAQGVVGPGTFGAVPPPFFLARPAANDNRNPLKPKKVAIIGTQPSSRMVAPFNDPEWTIWGTSPGNMNILPRIDAWFEMHVNLLWPEYRMYGEPYIDWVNKNQWPVIAIDQRFFPRAITYPIKEILQHFGKPQPYFFTSTFAYAMAYAIFVGVEEMALYGVDMSSKDEYILQRSGGHHFICVADDRGIKVTIPPESDLAQPPPLYGYCDMTPYGRKSAARERETQERMQQLEAQIGQMQQQLVYLKGALENQQYMRQVYGSVDQYAFNGFANDNGSPWQAAG